MKNLTRRFQILFYILWCLLLVGCSTTSTLNGTYRNNGNVFGDYYVLDNQTNRFEYFHHDFNRRTNGFFIQNESIITLKSDSINYYNNLDIVYDEKRVHEMDKVKISFADNSFEMFKEKFPEIQLTIILSGKRIKLGLGYQMVLDLDSKENIIELPDEYYDPEYFRVIGIKRNCDQNTSLENCEILQRLFQSRTYFLKESAFGIDVEINLVNILNKSLSQVRFIKIIDVLKTNEYFEVNDNRYEIIPDMGKTYFKLVK